MSDSQQATPAYVPPPSGTVPGYEIVPRGRGCVGSVVSNGCGCVAFLLGSALAVAFFGAHLLSGWGARAIEEFIGQYVDGTVEVSGVELSWSKPQSASSVSIYSADGEQIAQARLTLPSILDLIGEPRGERVFRIVLRSLNSQIDEDGTSDLGRTFEVLKERLSSYLSTLKNDVEHDSLHVVVVIEKAFFDDRAPGHAGVHIEDLTLDMRLNRIGAQIDLSECVLHVDEMDGVHEVGFDAKFEYGDDGRLHLTSAGFNADAIPRGVLRTLGVVSRVEPRQARRNPRRTRDIYDIFGERAGLALAAFMEDGAAINLTFDPVTEPDEPDNSGDSGTDSASPTSRLSLSMTAPIGTIELDADWRDGVFVPAELEGDRYPLQMTFTLPRRGPATLFEAIAPPGVTVDDHEAGLPWILVSSKFQLPVDASAFTLDGVGIRTGVLDSEKVASWLRTVEADLILRNSGGVPSRLRFECAEAPNGVSDPLDWTHRLTELSLRGELGGTLGSYWQTDQAKGRLASVTVSLPGRALGPRDMPRARVQASIPGMSLALLGTSAQMPDELRVLLPRRLHKLELGSDLSSIVMGSQQNGRSRVDVRVWTDPKTSFRGRFEDDEFHVPSARFPMVITRDVRDTLLLRVMPWLSAIEPLEDGAGLTLNLRDFAFTAGSGAIKESGEAVIELPTLRVKLKEELVKYFDLEDPEDPDRPDGWIEWTPAPIELSLAPSATHYLSVELPLGDDVEPSAMTGSFNRRLNRLSLTGLVDARSLSFQSGEDDVGKPVAGAEPGAETPLLTGDGSLPVEITISGAPDRLKVLYDPDFIKRSLNDLLNRVRGNTAEGDTAEGGTAEGDR